MKYLTQTRPSKQIRITLCTYLIQLFQINEGLPREQHTIDDTNVARVISER